MTVNIINEYIKIVKKQINEYMKLVFDNKFEKKYCDSYTEKYIKVRYYNFYEDDFNEKMRTRILDNLKKEQENLCIDNIEDREVIEQMCIFFYYVLYFDKVIQSRDIKKTIEKISKLRKRVLNIEDEEFNKLVYNTMKEFEKEKEKLVERFETDDFKLKITNYPDELNVYRVNLKYNFNFPLVYSEFAINKAFNIGIINEDKLAIEFYLISIEVLKDVLKQNFKKKYILEFAPSLFEKPKKLKSILNILNNPILQEKVSIKLRYEQFLNHKDIVYELLREGFRITAILDSSFTIDYKNIEDLKMFKYIIINSKLDCYNEIKRNKKNLNNVIEI